MGFRPPSVAPHSDCDGAVGAGFLAGSGGVPWDRVWPDPMIRAHAGWLATNAVRSRLTSHTNSGPSTMPMGGTMKKAKADRCAIIPQVRSSCVGGVPGAAGGAGCASSSFMLMHPPGVRLSDRVRARL